MLYKQRKHTLSAAYAYLSFIFKSNLSHVHEILALGNLPVPGRLTIWMIVGQVPTALAVGAGWGCLDIFTPIYPSSTLSPSLWEPTNQQYVSHPET